MHLPYQYLPLYEQVNGAGNVVLLQVTRDVVPEIYQWIQFDLTVDFLVYFSGA